MQVKLNKSWKTVKINNKNRDIPCNWNIADISKKIIEFPSSKLAASYGKKEGKYKFYNASEKQTLFCDTVQINEEAIIITTGGDYAFSLYSKGNFSFSSHVWCFKMLDDNNLFFNYLFKYYFNEIQSLSVHGFKLKNLNKKSFKKIQFHFPPIHQQNSIAHILSTQESIINDMEELIELYEKRLRYTNNELLSGRLRVKEVDGETVFYKNTEWKTEKVNGKDVEIPSDWCKHLISDVFNIKRGKVISKEDIKKKNGIYPVYSSATENNGVIGNISDFMFNGEYLTWTTDGVYAGTLFYRKGKFNCTNVCGILEKINLQLDTKSIYYFLKPTLPKYVTKLANSKLMSNTVAKIEFIFPEKNEENILISKTLTQQEELIQEQKELLELEKKRFTWLLENLLSGKYTVEESDDESLGKISLTDNSENVN